MHALPLWLIMSSALQAGAELPAEREAAVVALRDVAPDDWQLKPVKVGSPLWLDRDYAVTELSKGLQGGTMLVRDVADNREWLEPPMVTLKADCCVYAVVRWKYFGKAVLETEVFPILATQGWTTCEEKVVTSFNEGEDWGWVVFKKELKKGDKLPRLKDIEWKEPVVFIFMPTAQR